jgi:hypothetical protein
VFCAAIKLIFPSSWWSRLIALALSPRARPRAPAGTRTRCCLMVVAGEPGALGPLERSSPAS